MKVKRERLILVLGVMLMALVVLAGARKAQAQCCTIPTSESSAANGADPSLVTVGRFIQTLGTASFAGRYVQEGRGENGDDDVCYNESEGQSPYGPYHISGGHAYVGSSNTYGDRIGYGYSAVDWYREAASEGLFQSTIPCWVTAYQNMAISCPDIDSFWTYETNNSITIRIESELVRDCRYPSLGSGDCVYIWY